MPEKNKSQHYIRITRFNIIASFNAVLPQTFFELQIDPIFIQRSNNLQSISPYGYAFKKLESEDLIKSTRYDNYVELK